MYSKGLEFLKMLDIIMIETIFTVKNQDLERLDPQESVDIFRELLWAEATSMGIGKNLINVPSAITVADGGIDAEVRNVTISGGQGIIKNGLTRYQIKTGEFSLQSNANIKKILLNEKSTKLKTRVESCLDNNGTLVVVLFGWDNPETKDKQIIDGFKEILKKFDLNYMNAKIEIWRQNNIISFLQSFPSLCLKVNRRGGSMFQTHKSWSMEAEIRREFRAGQVQEELISKIQNELRGDVNEAIHIRVFGEPGIGKTRLVFEATNIDDLRSSVIYFDTASKFIDSELMNEILKEDNKFTTILVIDECNQKSRFGIWNKLKYRGSRIKLVSIYNEYDDTSGNIVYFDVPKLDNNQISEIIQGYGILKDQADRWPEYCGGSPRVAHVIGQNLKNNPEDLLKNPDTVAVWGRFIACLDDPNSQIVRERTLVLQHIALFKKFGFGGPVKSEAQIISEMIEQANPQITWSRFQELIQELRSRKILQGEFTLYITPKALHVKLWTDWWDIFGNSFDFEKFSNELPPSCVNGFSR